MNKDDVNDIVIFILLSKPIVYKYYEDANEKEQLKLAKPIVAVGLDVEKLWAVFSKCEELQSAGKTNHHS